MAFVPNGHRVARKSASVGLQAALGCQNGRVFVEFGNILYFPQDFPHSLGVLCAATADLRLLVGMCNSRRGILDMKNRIVELWTRCALGTSLVLLVALSMTLSTVAFGQSSSTGAL